jgi:hypothetical protein
LPRWLLVSAVFCLTFAEVLSLLQAKNRFCVLNGLRSYYERDGKRHPLPTASEADRARAKAMILLTFILSVLITCIFALRLM